MGKNTIRGNAIKIKMKLYVHQVSPYARLTQVVKELLNLDVEVRTVDLFTGEHYREWYTAINPKKKVPALQLDDGTVITESAVIAQYFCKLNPTDYYPNDALTQAKIDEALADVSSVEWLYFAAYKFFGGTESEEGLKKIE